MGADDKLQRMVAGYGKGGAGIKQLNEAIGTAWGEVLGDPDASRKAAAALGIRPDELATRFPASPYKAEPNESGFGPVETAILIFASTVAYDLAKDLTKAAADAGLRALWKTIQPKVEGLLPLGGLGDEKKVDDKKQQGDP
jgi:hypothetical protein